MTPLVIDTPERRTESIYTVGTLRYNKRQLYILFFWLMWNDFSITLIEQVGSLNSFLMRDHGATFFQMSMIGTIGFFVPWINPWVSTWSDRLRSKWGRRRPFLFFATPFFAFFLAATPFMPEFFQRMDRIPWIDSLSHHIPFHISGEVLFIGLCGFIGGLFNAVVQAIFSYLYWDVVPDSLQGRFQSMSKTAALIASLVWSFFLFGLYDHHVKWVYFGTAAFCLVVYIVSVWQIKEGEYPPPDQHKTGGIFAPIRAYFVECFSESYYLWIFLGSLLYQVGNQGGGFQMFYLKEDLHLPMGVIGETRGTGLLLTTGFGMVCGFYLGTMTDRLKPVRLMGPVFLISAIIPWLSYYFVVDALTYTVQVCLVNIIHFVLGVVVSAFTVEVFPREKLGQFCSAQAVFYQFAMHFLNPAMAYLFDVLHNNRYGFIWQGSFYFFAGLVYLKVYLNWRRRHGQTMVPHAG